MTANVCVFMAWDYHIVQPRARASRDCGVTRHVWRKSTL